MSSREDIYEDFLSSGVHGESWPHRAYAVVPEVCLGKLLIVGTDVERDEVRVHCEVKLISLMRDQLDAITTASELKLTIYLNYSPCANCSVEIIRFLEEVRKENIIIEIRLVCAQLCDVWRETCLNECVPKYIYPVQYVHGQRVNRNVHEQNVNGLKSLKEYGINLSTFGESDWKDLGDILGVPWEEIKLRFLDRDNEDVKMKSDLEKLLDLQDGEEYGRLVGSIITNGAITLALALAHETGILQALQSAKTSLTSREIAQRAQLKERYVREVLGSLTSARLVQLVPGSGISDEREGHFFLSENHKDILVSSAADASLLAAAVHQYSSVKKCLPIDGPIGVRYSPEVFDIMETMGEERKDGLTEIILRETPGLKKNLEEGIQVAEVGCGTGRLARQLAAMFPHSHFTLTDVTPKPLERGKALAEAEGLTNLTFHTLDIYDLNDDWKERFDWIMAQNVIHDLPYPQRAVEVIKTALRPEGYFSMIDICGDSYLANNVGKTEAAFFYSLSTFLCLPESFQKADSQALGACWGQQRATKVITAAGFKLLSIAKPPKPNYTAVYTCQK